MHSRFAELEAAHREVLETNKQLDERQQMQLKQLEQRYETRLQQTTAALSQAQSEAQQRRTLLRLYHRQIRANSKRSDSPAPAPGTPLKVPSSPALRRTQPTTPMIGTPARVCRCLSSNVPLMPWFTDSPFVFCCGCCFPSSARHSEEAICPSRGRQLPRQEGQSASHRPRRGRERPARRTVERTRSAIPATRSAASEQVCVFGLKIFSADPCFFSAEDEATENVRNDLCEELAVTFYRRLLQLERERTDLLQQCATLTTRCQNQQYLLFLAEQGHDISDTLHRMQKDAEIPALSKLSQNDSYVARESIVAYEVIQRRCNELEITVQHLKKIIDLHERQQI